MKEEKTKKRAHVARFFVYLNQNLLCGIVKK